MDRVLNLREIKPISLDEMAKVTYDKGVLEGADDKRTRITVLDKAVTLGRNAKVRTSLVFKTNQGYRSIQCVVLGLNLSGVVIEGNHFIPMHAIYSADIR